MIISAPTHFPCEPEYDFERQQALERNVLDMIDRAERAGWQSQSVLNALAEIVGKQMVGDEIYHDPTGKLHTHGGGSAENLVARFISGRPVPEA